MAEYLLTPPTVDEGFGQYERLTSPLWRYMQTEVAQSIVKLDGTWLVARIGSYPELSDLDAYYQGGSNYVVDQATRDDMVADGLGAYLSAIGGADYGTEVLDDAPAVYWRLGETAGLVAADSSGNGRDGTYGASNPVAGLIVGDSDGAVSSLGTGSETLVSYTNSPTNYVSALDGVAFEMWVQSTAADFQAGSGSELSGVALVVLCGYPIAGDVTAIASTEEAPGSPAILTVAAPTWNDDTIHHLVASADGTDLRLYMDGALIGTTALVGTFASMQLGCAQPTAGGLCTLDEVAFYDHALSADRVLAHYTAGVA